MKSFEEFAEFLSEQHSEPLQELEARRKGMRSRRGWLGGLLAAAVTSTWALAYLGMVPSFVIVVPVILGTPAAFYVYKKYYLDDEIPVDFKNLVVKNLVEFVDPSLSYEPTEHIAYEDFMDSKLYLTEPDHFTGDDLISGSIEGVQVSFSELIATYESKDLPLKKKAPWETMFHGLFLMAEAPIELKGEFFILPSKLQKRMGYVGRLVQAHNLRRGKYVLPRDFEFRKYFAVYTDDLKKGELLLTDGLMEKMMRLRKSAGAEVSVSIIGNKIYVAVDMRREIFKIRLHQPLINTDYLRGFYNDLYYMLTLVEDLNFDAFLEEG